MDKNLGPLFYFACAFLPILAILAVLTLFVVFPILKAPRAEKIAKAARKYLKGHDDVTRPEIERYLRRQFVPEEGQGLPVEDPGAGATFFFAGFYGLGLRALVHMLAQMRDSLTTMFVERRIARVLNTLGVEPEGERRSRRRSRGRGY